MKDVYVESGFEQAKRKCDEIERKHSLFAQDIKAGEGLSSKHKELIGLAVATAKGCEWCVNGHVERALGYGATVEEIMESAAIAVLMDGGPSGSRLRQLVLRAVEYSLKGYRVSVRDGYLVWDKPQSP
jgi:AhpD family alkylhydroperoxidase